MFGQSATHSASLDYGRTVGAKFFGKRGNLNSASDSTKRVKFCIAVILHLSVLCGSVDAVAGGGASSAAVDASQQMCLHKRHTRFDNLRTLIVQGNRLDRVQLHVSNSGALHDAARASRKTADENEVTTHRAVLIGSTNTTLQLIRSNASWLQSRPSLVLSIMFTQDIYE